MCNNCKEASTKKGILEFNLDEPYAQEEMETALKAMTYKSVLSEIQNEVFRPARKHGYPDRNIEELIEKCGIDKCENGEEYHLAIELIEKLEERFIEIIRDNELEW